MSTVEGYTCQLSNDDIRTEVVRSYRQFVADVDPKGGIMDYLIEGAVVNIETKERITCHLTRQDRCRALLDELLSSSHSRAFIVLHQALSEYYPWLVDRMQQQQQQPEPATRTGIGCCPDVVDSGKRVGGMNCCRHPRAIQRAFDAAVVRCYSDGQLNSSDEANHGRYYDEPDSGPTMRVQDEMSRVKQSEKNLRIRVEELVQVETDLRKRLERLTANETNLMQQLNDARTRLAEMEARLAESEEREHAWKLKVEQAALLENLLRLEIKQAVEDERLQLKEQQFFTAPTDCMNLSDNSPKLIHTIPGTLTVYGLTTLDQELYVARDRTNVIDVFDVNSLTSLRSLTIRHTSTTKPARPLDLASCDSTSSIYVNDCANGRIHRLEPCDGRVVDSWRVDGQPWGLSITSRATLIVCCRRSGRLCEFAPNGTMIREVKLAQDVGHPVHAVELDSATFGTTRFDADFGNQLPAPRWIVCLAENDSQRQQQLAVSGTAAGHRICTVNASGRLVQAGRTFVGQPHYLALTRWRGGRRLLVADCGVDTGVKVMDAIRLDAEELHPSTLIDVGSVQGGPHRLCGSRSTRRLFVGLWDGRVLVYQLQPLEGWLDF